jgi:hypothetical protein
MRNDSGNVFHKDEQTKQVKKHKSNPNHQGLFFSSARNYAGLDYELEVILLDLF